MKLCASCIKNIGAARPDFSSRSEEDVSAACDSDLNKQVNRFSKALYRWMFTFSQQNLVPGGENSQEKDVLQWHKPGILSSLFLHI